MATSFTPPDYYLVDELLTEEERLIRDTVRAFVEERVLPIVASCAREERFPQELVPEIAEMGLLGANLEGYGCAGLGSVAYGLIMQELERGDSGLRSFVSVQGSLAMFAIHHFGSEEQKNRWLPEMASGERIGCFGLTEPDFGSDPGGLLCRAELDGDSYVLNGNKMWITNGCIADVAVVWAKEEGRIRGFVVEKGTPGFSTTLQKGKWSLRASVTSELHFEDCRIPVANRLATAEGIRGPLSCLNQARYGISWGAVGAAMACYCEALEYAGSRIQFGKPIASFQLVQTKLVEMLSEITKAQLLVHRLGRLKETGQLRPEMVSLAKRNNVAMALEICRTARDILAANGITDEYQVGRHMLNLESVKTYEGTHDIHGLILGRDITGIAAFGVD
jgi:glutaryl-CoA dehydrogenase